MSSAPARVPMRLPACSPTVLLVLLLAAAALWPSPVAGQAGPPVERPLPGVVWDVPSDGALAASDLRRMAAVGVRAVRTGIVEGDALLTLADTLGLRLFQELPLAFVPGAAMADSAEAVRVRLDAVLRRAQAHPSARHFGLARSSDTSDPAACDPLAALADRIRAAVPGARVYYVTPFLGRDRCGAAVDFVLVDALDAADPVARLAAWRAAHPDVPAGVGALGTWVADGQGLRAPRSPERQGRYLEDALGSLLADTSGTPAVFVHRWRDQARAEPDPLAALHSVRGRRYGLLTREETPRPAFAVVRGLFTGTQDVFAFALGDPAPPSGAWAVLVGWGLVLLLGLFYAFSPRMRHMVPRYFRAHGFYREAVREGRDVLLGTSAVLLLVLSVSVATILTVALRALREEQAFTLFVRWLPGETQAAAVSLLGRPLALVFLCASVYAVALIVWAAVLSVASRRRQLLAPGQALMLILWPRWTLLVLLLGALVVSTLPPPMARDGALVLIGAWLLCAAYANARTLYDYGSVTRVSPAMMLAAGVGNPLVLSGLVLLFFVLEHRSRAAFLLHLVQGG